MKKQSKGRTTIIIKNISSKTAVAQSAFLGEPDFVPFGDRSIVAEDEDDGHGHADGKGEAVPEAEVEKFPNFIPFQMNKGFRHRMPNHIVQSEIEHL